MVRTTLGLDPRMIKFGVVRLGSTLEEVKGGRGGGRPGGPRGGPGWYRGGLWSDKGRWRVQAVGCVLCVVCSVLFWVGLGRRGVEVTYSCDGMAV